MPQARAHADAMEILGAFPHEVSCQLLQAFPGREQILLDAGCGTDPKLGQFAVRRTWQYVGVDNGQITEKNSVVSSTTILERKLGLLIHNYLFRPFFTWKADIRKPLPVQVPKANICHLRFVLRHIPREQWSTVLRNLAEKTSTGLLLLEYDWSTFAGCGNTAVHVNRFRDLGNSFMKQLGVCANAGQYIEAAVRDTFPNSRSVEFSEHQRPQGSYTQELKALALLQAGAADSLGLSGDFESFGQRFRQYHDLFAALEKMQTPLPFIPPKICAVTVRL